MRVYDGEFTSCQATGNDGNGAFMFASAGSVVHISGGVVRGNIAERRAGAVSVECCVVCHLSFAAFIRNSRV